METTVNQRIVMLRTFLKLSQNEFANKVGLTQVGIWGLEQDAKPRKATLEKIIEATGVDREWLFNGVGEFRLSNETVATENPWKDEAYKNLKEENSFLKDQIQMMREMISMLKPQTNFLNGNAFSGVFADVNTGVSVRA